MRDWETLNKSLNTVTGVGQRGFNPLAREQWVYAKKKKTAKVGRSGGYKTDQGAVGNCTSVVAVIRSQTQNKEERTTESWFLDPLDTCYLASFVQTVGQ